jgi:hypothetical protein
MADDLDLALSRFRAAVASRLASADTPVVGGPAKVTATPTVSVEGYGSPMKPPPIESPLTSSVGVAVEPEPVVEHAAVKRTSIVSFLGRVLYRVTHPWAHLA